MCNMQKIFQWMLTSCRAYSRSTKRASSFCARSIVALAAILICGASVFTACSGNDDNPAPPDLNLSEKIIGKWVFYDRNGELTPTNKKRIFTFVSTTKAYVSASRNTETEPGGKRSDHSEADVAISGNKVNVTTYPDEHTTVVDEFTVTAIDDKELTANVKVIVTVDGTVERVTESILRLTKVTADYSAAILGLWECQGITGGETNNDNNARLEFLADGTYRFYRHSDDGIWSLVPRLRNEYFVDGNLLCTRWQAEGEQMSYEWWEITSAADRRMQWTALRQRPDGTTFQQAVAWTKVN